MTPSGGDAKTHGLPTSTADYAVVGTTAYVGGVAGLEGGYVLEGPLASTAELPKLASFQGGVVQMAADERDAYVTTMKKEVLRISP